MKNCYLMMEMVLSLPTRDYILVRLPARNLKYEIKVEEKT